MQQYLTVNQRVILEHTARDGRLVSLNTKVADIVDNRYLDVNDPEPGAPFPLLPPGATVMLRVDLGATAYVGEALVHGRTEDGMIRVGVPLEMRRIAKRRFFRISVALGLEVDGTTCEALDLSGSGVLAKVPSSLRLREERTVEGRLTLDHRQRVWLTLRPVRIGPAAGRSRVVAFDFVDVDRSAQEKIISFCIRQQRKRLRSTSS